MTRFYREAVGLELIEPRRRMRRNSAPAGVAFLELLHRPDLLPRDPAAAGLYHTAFLLPSRADLGRWLAPCRARSACGSTARPTISSARPSICTTPRATASRSMPTAPRAEWRWEGGQVVMANDRLDMIGLRALATRARGRGAPAGTRIGHVHLQVGDVEPGRARSTPACSAWP